MKRKKIPKKTTPVSTEQIHALRKLARAGRTDEALKRLDALKSQHPGFKPLYSLACELAATSDYPYQAICRAWDWTHASPNSEPAWQALAVEAFALGYPALGRHAEIHLAQLTSVPAPPALPLPTPFGDMSFDEAVANDIARALVQTRRFTEAMTALEGFDHLSSLNNRAMIHFQQGDIPNALAGFEVSWRREPGNIFTLDYIIRLRLWRHGRDATTELLTPLKSAKPLRDNDALAKVQSLLILGEWQAADRAWRESAEADFWDEMLDSDPPYGSFHFAGAIAALRLGDLKVMTERFDLAMEVSDDRDEEIEHIGMAAYTPGLAEMPDIPLAGFSWIPLSWIERMMELKTRKGKVFERDYLELLHDFDAHPDYLATQAQWGGEMGRYLAVALLKQRAKGGDTTARQTLLELLTLPCGSDEVRHGLLTDLVEEGLLPPDNTVSMLTQGEVREIKHMAVKLHADADPPELPTKAQAQLEKSFVLLHEGRHKACMQLLEELLRQHPGLPMLYNNLAGIKEALDYPEYEIEALFSTAHTIDPDYLFAIAGLARLEAKRGDLDKAAEMLRPLLERESYHFTEWRAILMTQLEIAKQNGDLKTASNLMEQIEHIQQQFA